MRYILQKIFGSKLKQADERLSSYSDTFVQEFIKLAVFTQEDTYDIDHWTSELLGYLKRTDAGTGLGIKLFLSLEDNYENLPRRHGKSFIDKLRNNKELDEYIKQQYDSLYNERVKGLYKYRDLINSLRRNNKIPDNEIIQQKAKCIALQLLDQIPINTRWDNPIVKNTKANWNKEIKIENITFETFRRIVESIL